MTNLTLPEAIAEAKTFYSEYRYEAGDALSAADALILNAVASGELIPKAMSDLDKAIAEVKAMDMDGDAGWTAEEVAATGAARDQATIATILNAVASGELIPKAELAATQAKLAIVVEALQSIANMVPHAMPDYTHQVWKTARFALEGAKP